MKKILFLLLAIFVSTAAVAQTSTVKGNLIDSYTSEGVIGAIVELIPLGSSRDASLTTSGYDGAFSFSSMPYGQYIMKASFMGYNDAVDTIEINTPRLLLEKFRIKESSTQIDAVVKEVQAMRTSQRGDTLSYNAAAFKVADDADVEGLLKKMPGITVNNGEVTAQGESIKKIYVDGREFFGSDVTTAISSLPAEMVDNVEVYDKLSDNAELSGMDDGSGYKAINIVTKRNMREGFFGKMYAGAGYQPQVEGDIDHLKYMSGGSVNYFKGNNRLTMLGLLNNINQQNFSFDDILGVSDDRKGASNYMVRPQAGVAEVGALGLNYSGVFGKNDKVQVAASYFYNGTDTYNEQTIERWYEDPSAIDTLYQTSISQTPNYNHRINGRVEWKVTPTQQITLRQNASFQSNISQSETDGYMFGESGYNVIDSYKYANKGGYSSNTSLSYITRLGKAGRTITLNGGLYLADQGDNYTNNYSNKAKGYELDEVWHDQITSIENQYASTNLLRDLYHTKVYSPTATNKISGEVSYAEPIGKKTRLTLKYSFSNKEQSTTKETFATDEDYTYAPTDRVDRSSNQYTTLYTTHQVTPGVYYTNGKSKALASVTYQLSDLSGSALLPGTTVAEPISHDPFTDITYALMGQIYINQSNSLRTFINSRTSDPWVGHLVDAYSLANVQNISHGNPDLVPAYVNSARMFYINSNIEKGTTFMIMGGFENQNNYIADHVIYYPAEFEIDGITYSPREYSTYVNLDNYWSLRARMEYGFPISLLKSNFNISGGINYRLTPSMFGGTVDTATGMIEGGELNENKSMTYSTSAVLGSNISENVDFTLSWNGEYSEATNSISSSAEVNEYFSQTASANMKFVVGAGFTFTGAVTYKEYKGITNDYRETYTLCNAFIGKKIFRNKRGELNVGVNDIFNQNTSFNRSTGTGYTQNTINSVIGRYYSVQLVYNLRSFGGKKGGSEHRGPGMGGGYGQRPMHPMH